MTEGKKYLYGPVPSRRLGLSLGVDVTAFKHCTLDCVYCQLGRTTKKTIERKDYVPVEAVLDELKDKLSQPLQVDFITISGSGEPTLNSRLGELIDGVRKITDIPVAVLTNGTLLYKQDVRTDCAKADLVLPSLDAGDEQTFKRINRPHRDISIEKLVSGLCAFRNEFAGQIWLEVFLIDGINTSDQQIAKIKGLIEHIRPDKVQLNTAVRPTAEAGVKRVTEKKLSAIAEELGGQCEIIADFSRQQVSKTIESIADEVLSILKRRPCSLNDICSSLGIHQNEALKYIADFQNQGVIDSEQKDGETIFKSK